MPRRDTAVLEIWGDDEPRCQEPGCQQVADFQVGPSGRGVFLCFEHMTPRRLAGEQVASLMRDVPAAKE